MTLRELLSRLGGLVRTNGLSRTCHLAFMSSGFPSDERLEVLLVLVKHKP